MSNGDSQQPNMIVGLTNNTMVFCGLLVAGTITLLAAGPINVSAGWVKIAAFAAIALSLLGGMLSIISAMYAHNIVRRSEWDDEKKQKRPNKTIESARSVSLHSAGIAFWCAIGSALALTVLAVSFFFPGNQGSIKRLKISAPGTHNGIEIDGPVSAIKIIESENHCEIKISTPTLHIESSNDGECVLSKE